MTDQQTTHKLEGPNSYWATFRKISLTTVEISYFWMYDIQRSQTVTIEEARKIWANLLTQGYYQ